MNADLAAFLSARLDEHEAVADEFHNGLDCRSCEPLPMPCDCGYPDRVRRDIRAKRAILAQWMASPPESPVLTFALCNLAAIYNDYPDYRGEWKP